MTEQDKSVVLGLAESFKELIKDFKTMGILEERNRIKKLIQENQHRFIERGQFNEWDLMRLIDGEGEQ